MSVRVMLVPLFSVSVVWLCDCAGPPFRLCRDEEWCPHKGGSGGIGESVGEERVLGSGGDGEVLLETGMGGVTGEVEVRAAGGVAGSGGIGDGAGTASTGEGGGASAPKCDPLASPAKEACVVSERYGVFVSPMGSDTAGDGSRSSPFKTVGQGLTKGAGRNVYVCATGGVFAESVTIGAGAKGTSVWGGFDCGSWQYSAELKAQIESPTSVGLVLQDVEGVRLGDLQVVAKAGSNAGESSVALRAKGSQASLVRVSLVAKNGANGTPGSAPGAMPIAPGGQGSTGVKTTCASGGWTTNGNGGGIGGPGSLDGNSGAAEPPAPWDDKRKGVGGKTSVLPHEGAPGAYGKPGSPGAGATGYGTLTPSGWVAAAGMNGTSGTPGQGGGGSGQLLGSNGVTVTLGGAGGCGGCGGFGATPGTGGGASFGILSEQSVLDLTGCSILLGNGGDGGAGAWGQPGQEGGSGETLAFAGGLGGNGGDGGPSGGGAGGLSVGIAFVGTEPIKNGVAIMFGAPGKGGAGPASNGGIDGLAREVLGL